MSKYKVYKIIYETQNPPKNACLLVQTTANSLNHNTSNLVGASVGSWTTVLEVSIALLGARSWNTDGRPTVGNTIGELINGTSLVPSSKTESIVVTVNSDVLLVTLGELLNGSLNVLHATLFSHSLSRDVGVETRSIPVTWDWLGVEGNLDTEVLSDSVEEITSDPKLVTHRNSLARPHLELPLRWKNLSVDTRDLDAGVQASLVVGLNNVTAVDLAGTNTAVVWSLGTGVTSLWPSVWVSILVKEGIFLLKTEPWLLVFVGLHELSTVVSVVELVWGTIRVPALVENQDIVTSTERIWVNGNWSQVDIGVLTGSLSGGGTVEVPFREVINGIWLFG